MILSRWPILEVDFWRFSLNGFVHHLWYGDGATGAGVGLAKVRMPNGLVANLYTSHYHAEYNRCSLFSVSGYKVHRDERMNI